ncbi:PAS domain S-box protein [Flavobacterium sp. LT1R49]|uniref:PAS domain S-box protein n=1 Tax=Flavobacterium arabinosi TaxID=3398737 RepID=UPI003A8AC7FB
MLSFASELCEVPCGFISIIGIDHQIIKARIGFETLIVPENMLLFIEPIINHKKKSIVYDINQDVRYHSNPSPFSFFAGFPICINESLVIGTLCIVDTKPKNLSPIQLKSLECFVVQIQSFLELYIQKEEFKKTIKQQENQLQLFIDNSKEILYELNLEGIFTYVSKNLITFLGREADEITGKNIALFIHPEDMGMCINHMNNVVETGKSENELIYRILHKYGHYVWHSSNLKFLEKEGNAIFIGNCRDITEHVETQQKLLLQKEFYEKILDRLPIDIAVFDSNYRYTYLNPAAIKNNELRKFIIGKDDFEYAEYTGRDNIFAKNRRAKFMVALEGKEVIEWEDRIQRQNGESTYHTRKFAPVFLEDGSLEMMVGFGVDITESKKNQDEIFKSRQLTKSIIKNVATGILVQGPQSEIFENNKAACEMLGLTEDQLLGKTSFDEHWKVIHLDGSEFLSEEHPVPQAIQKLKPINNVVMGVYRPMLNDLVWLLVDAIPVFGDFNELLYVICSFNDITAQKNAEDALKISNERFIYSSEATSDALWDWNMITNEIFVGESYAALFGHRFENNIITGQKCENFVHLEDKDAYYESIDKCINSDIYRWSEEYRYLKSDGTYAYVKDKAVIIRNDKGEAVRMIGAMQDITNEKKLKDELQQSEERFKGAFEHSAVGMAIVNLEGFWMEVNSRLCEILGYTKEEFKTLTFEEITYCEDLEKDLANKKNLDSGEASNFSMEKRYIHKNKSLVWVNLFVSIVRNNLGKIEHYIPQIIDITERIKIEVENKLLTDENNRNKTIQLNEVKNMYRLLADNTIDLVCLHNLDSSFQYVSPSIQKLLGYTPEELIGKLPQEFVHPEDIEILLNSIRRFVTEVEDVSVRVRFKNIEDNYFWFETKAILVKENGIPISFQSSTRDITQRKEAEEIVENTLIQERELNELRSNLVSTISHEFRTPMTTIRASAELIAMYLEGYNFENSIHVEKRVNIITEEIDRIVELMNAVLTISKDDSGKTNFNPVKFDLKQVCIDVIETSYSSQNDKRKVQTTFAGDTFYVFADKKLMEYSILNLLNNAFKYSEGFGDIILNLFTANGTTVIEIIDFGIGVPEKDQSKLFNTFFRASNTEGLQGTGLGLYIVKTFTEKNLGTVQLESQLGKGTKVTLKFPV